MKVSFVKLVAKLLATRPGYGAATAECHFIAPVGYTIESLRNYKKDLGKYKICSENVNFTFWVTGNSETIVDDVSVKGYGENFQKLLEYMANSQTKKQIVSCTDDIRVNLFALLLSFLWKCDIIYYNLSLPAANKLMVPKHRRSWKHNISQFITYCMYRKSSIITFTRIMAHEVLYKTGENNFKKYASCDHTIREGVNDLIASVPKPRVENLRRPALFTRFEKMKRSEDGIEAYLQSIAYKKGVGLDVYGGGTELEAVKEKYSKHTGIEFHGQILQSEIIEAMVNSSFIIAPHSGGVSLEAAAASRAVISYGCNAMPEYIFDRVTGLLVDLGDEYSFVEAINLLHTDVEYAKRLGDFAHRALLERYSEKNMQMSHAHLARRIDEIL